MFGKCAPAWLLALLLLAPLPASAQTAGTPEKPAAEESPDLAQVEKLIVEATNRLRREKGLEELRVNQDLTRAARSFADFLGRTDKFSHTADGRQPQQRTAEQGYEDCIVAENIAWESNPGGFTTQALADALMKGWENSPPHRRNLLDPDLREIGVGVARSDRTGRYYGVQDFGRPQSDAVRFRIANDTEATVHYTVDGKDYAIEPGYTMTHRACTSPELKFSGTDRTYRPRAGSHYTLRGDGHGGYTVREGQPRSSGGGP